MARGFSSSTGTREQTPPGTYEVMGFTYFTTNQVNGQPVYTLKDGQQSVGVNFIPVDPNVISPAWKATPEQLALLVTLSEEKLSSLPDKNTWEFLGCLRTLMSDKKLTVVVKNAGWVSYVVGATLPEGPYMVKFVGARTMDNTLPLVFQEKVWSESNKSEQMIFKFEVVGGVGGESPYNGIVSEVFVYNPFHGVFNGSPQLKANSKGDDTKSAIQFKKFVEAFCPELNEYEAWTEEELANPIELVVKKAVKNERVALCFNEKSTRSDAVRFNLNTLSNVDAEPKPIEVVPSGFPPEVEKEHPLLCQWVTYINGKCPGAVVLPVQTKEQLVLSDTGRVWANVNLKEVCAKAGVEPKARKLFEYTEPEIEKILAVAWGDGF
jgi:hypothetical protein